MLDICDLDALCFASSESFIRRNLRIHFEKSETQLSPCGFHTGTEIRAGNGIASYKCFIPTCPAA
jgi:hypothetical protein